MRAKLRAFLVGLLLTVTILACHVALFGLLSPDGPLPTALPPTQVRGTLSYLPSRGRGTTPAIVVASANGAPTTFACAVPDNFVDRGVIPCNDREQMRSLIEGRIGTVWYFNEAAIVLRVIQLHVDGGAQFHFANQLAALRAQRLYSNKVAYLSLAAEAVFFWLLFSYVTFLVISRRGPTLHSTGPAQNAAQAGEF